MDEVDYGVVYDVLCKDFLSNPTGGETRTTMDDEKIIFGGHLTAGTDLSKEVKSVGEFVLKSLQENDGNRVAFIDATSGKSIRYREVIDKSLKVAAFLREIGVQPGDVVSILSPNCIEFPLILCGCLYLGATVNACNPIYTESEIQHVLKLTRPRVVFASTIALKNVLSVASDSCDFIQDIICMGSTTPTRGKVVLFDEIIRNKKLKMEANFQPEPVNITENISLILVSSGTTGLPKAVAITQENILTMFGINREQRAAIPSSFLPLISFVAIPFCHTYGLFSILSPILYGMTVVFMQKFSGRGLLEAIQRYKIEVLLLVPSLWNFLSKSPLVDKHDLSSVKVIASGAASLSTEIEESVRQRFPNVIYAQGYGMTEGTLSLISRRGLAVEYKTGSVGSVNPGVYCKVVDPTTGRICGVNESGELCFKGKLLMKGYLRDEKATREIIDSDGWLHSGDIGYYDENRHFYIVDRLKELIKYKGFQVAPAELENVLLGHPMVLDAAVIGISDPVSQELPRGFVVKRPGAKITERELIAFVAEKVSEQKHLRGGLQFVKSIPRNPNGKILRRELRKQATVPMSKL